MESPYCYIPILKNAHSWGVEIFETLYNFAPTNDIRNKKYIVFLRDPIRRWYSSVSQWFVGKVDNNFKLDSLTLELIFDAVRLDDHGNLQSSYLYGLNLNDCIFFNIDEENFEFKLSHFLNKYLGYVQPLTNFENKHRSTDNLLKINLNNQLTNYVKENTSRLDKIRFYYKPDIDLINVCKFYNPYKV